MISKKHFFFIFASWALIYFYSPSNASEVPKMLAGKKFDIPQEMVKEFYKSLDLAKLDKGSYKMEDGYISATVNDFADTILKNIGIYAVNNSLDPMPIDGINQGFLTAHITLKNGSLNGISTINRNGDVNVKYSPTTKIADLDIPILFDDIGFSYHYHVIILLVGPWGEMIGKIQDCKVFVCLSFDFNTYVASVKQLQMMDSGHASLTFVGGVIELVLDVMSEFMSVILHPFIIAIIQGIVQTVANLIVTAVNHGINGTFISPDDAAHNASNLTQWIFK